MKKTLLKSFFLTFFSLCFMCVGITTLFMKEEYASAETVAVESSNELGLKVNGQNNTAPYFSIEEYAPNSAVSDATSFISDNTFLYYVNAGGTSNTLTFSLKMNGAEVNEGAADIYQYVYYPDENNLSTFYFYTVESTNLYINGVRQTISGDKTFNEPNPNKFAFEHEDGAILETYELNFSANDTTNPHTLSLLDEEGKLIEGRYTLSILMTLWTCYDGRSDMMEEKFDSDTVTLQYDFLVLNRSNYILNTRPIISASNFDSSYQVTSTQSEVYGNYYYFNYSQKDNKIANLTYDPTKYDISITKSLNQTTSTQTLKFVEENVVVENGIEKNDGIEKIGDNLVTYVKNSKNSVSLYFKDVGNYSITFSAVATFNYGEDSSTFYKYSLVAVTNSLKRVMVYGYGYQATYADYDNNGEYSEFKSYLNKEEKFDGSFYESADITADFLASNSSYGQNTTQSDNKGNTTFVINNILSYINNKRQSSPASTNQTPIRFNSNATMTTSGNVLSKLYCTEEINNSRETNLMLGNERLYEANYTGGSISDTGKYIFLMVYTFNNFYTTAGNPGREILFYQVFYFQIEKDQPTINLKTEDNYDFSSKRYTNQNVIIENLNIEKIHNKDVTVQIYAKDYNTNTYLSEFGYENGISMADAPNYDGGTTYTLTKDAHYTIRIYFTCEMATISTKINDTNYDFERQFYFTIDKQKIDIESVTARNVSLISGTTNYAILQEVENVSTNQDFIVSWDEKNSLAPTYAKYRYFPIIDDDFYGNFNENQLSEFLNRFLVLNSSKVLPVNFSIDLSAGSENWISYQNTKNLTDLVNQTISPSGLYLFDIYDEAGNHTYKIYIKDTTSPIFALQTQNVFTIPPASYFISEDSTLYWGDYKAIQFKIEGNDTWDFETVDINNLQESDYKFDVFVDKDGKYNSEIYKAFYNILYNRSLIQYMTSLDNSRGMYLTIKIEDVSYQTPIGSDDYEKVENKNSIFLTTDTEYGYTYRVLIRDESNNKYSTGTNFDSEEQKEAFNQYSNYYSARQTIIVSFDDSEFKIYYDDNILSSNNFVEEKIADEDGVERSKLITYLSPISAEKQIYLSFIPTKMDESSSQTVQVESVTIDYYKYDMKTYEHADGSLSYYYSISDQVAPDTIYEYKNGTSFDEEVHEIRPDTNFVTTEGKYVITRTYKTGDGYMINEKDHYSLTYVLYVDRNEVISEQVPTSSTHNESLVGGEIFVGMYDSETQADIVVTFPNSVVGSTQVGNTTLYNGNTTTPSWVTNKLPVKIHIPTYKYTQYAVKVDDGNGKYHFEVAESVDDNRYYDPGENPENDNYIIDEYLIYAEIYKNYKGTTDQPLYKTTTSWNDPNPANAESVNGFLNFYDVNGSVLNSLTEEGLYTVMIYQGYRSAGVGDDSFKKLSTFTFEIENVAPDFTVKTESRELNSDTVYVSGNKFITRYHTNQNTVQVLWNKPEDTDIFKAEIDQTKIKVSLVTKNGQTFTPGDGYVEASELFSKIEVSGKNYIGYLTFSALNPKIYEGNFYENGNYIDITMQYQNHNDSYYQTVTKRIYIDTEAPQTNIEHLVNNAISTQYSASLISYDDLRIRRNILGEVVEENDKATYNVSADSGIFEYFSYSVAQNYLNILKETVRNDSNLTIYYREFNNKYTSNNKETSPNMFLEGSFSNIQSLENFKPGNYYEIVESDLAGNLTIYTIYITDYSANGQPLITYEAQENGEIVSKSLTQDDYNEALSINSTLGYSPLLNIYAKPGMKITDISYFGNVWTNFSVTEVNENGLGSTTYYFTSPFADMNNKVYRISGNNFVEENIDTIFNGNLNTRYKSVITFYDQVLNSKTYIYLNTRNVNLNAQFTTQIDQNNVTHEYINFNQPTITDLESDKIATTFLKSIKIYTPGSEELGTDDIIYYLDDFENIFGYTNLWQSSNEILVSTTSSLLRFEINPNLNIEDNTRIIYEYTDNYGTTYTEVHLYHETTGYLEISSNNTLYSFYENDNNLYYITSDDFKYTYNEAKYTVEIYQNENENWINVRNTTSYVLIESNQINEGIIEIRFSSRPEITNYSYRYKLEVYDTESGLNEPPIKEIYFILNNEIPTPESYSMENVVNKFYFASNGRIITANILGLDGEEQVNYFSKVSLYYNTAQTFLPIKFELSLDGQNWEKIQSGTAISCPEDVDQQDFYLRVWYDIDEIKNLGYIDQTGNFGYIFEYIPPESVYHFKLSTTLTTAYTVMLQRGDSIEILKKTGQTFTISGKSYPNHYIANISYEQRENLLEIVTNAEQLIEATEETTYYIDPNDSSVVTFVYTISNLQNIGNSTDIPRFNTEIAITFIPPTNNFTKELLTYDSEGIIDDEVNLITRTSFSYIVPDISSVTELMLMWPKYYVVEQNLININITKNGNKLNPVLYTTTKDNFEYYYTYLTRSGQYRISLEDVAGNVQIFGSGANLTETFTLDFLKDIPFTITYVNPLTNKEETTEPISQAIYNGSVTLRLDSSTSSYYSSAGVQMEIKKNGNNFYSGTFPSGAYTISQTGYYSVTLSAISSSDNETDIRKQTYNFTILNPNEYRYSFIVNKYSNYYVESIIKDGVDVTETYLKGLNLDTITVDQKKYLAELTLSYLDEKTGAGKYVITINSNEKLYQSASQKTSWTFQVIIQVGRTNLITTSIGIGEATTDPITVQFNAQNVYEEFGETKLQIVYYDNNNLMTEHYWNVNEKLTGIQSYTIDTANDYYIQIVAPSGNLLYSGKITKNEPFNAATIIAIVVSVVVVLVVIILVILLRKRISVK